MQDKLINYSSATEYDSDEIFRLKESRVKTVKRDPDQLMDLYFQVDYNKTVIEREIYTILDFLSDIGGIMEMFIKSFGVMLAIIHNSYPEVFAASRLYRISQPSDQEFGKKDSNSSFHADQSSFFEPSSSNTK